MFCMITLKISFSGDFMMTNNPKWCQNKYKRGKNKNIHCRKINLKTKATLNDCRNKGIVTSQDFKLHSSVIILNSISFIENSLDLWLVFV